MSTIAQSRGKPFLREWHSFVPLIWRRTLVDDVSSVENGVLISEHQLVSRVTGFVIEATS